MAGRCGLDWSRRDEARREEEEEEGDDESKLFPLSLSLSLFRFGFDFGLVLIWVWREYETRVEGKKPPGVIAKSNTEYYSVL